MRRSRIPAGLLVALIAGAAMLSVSAGGGTAASTEPAAAQARMTLCTAQEVRSLVSRFFEDFAHGRLSKVDAAFAREPDFRWYGTDGPGGRRGTTAQNRSTLARYFAQRHRRHERLVLRWFRFRGNTVAEGPAPYGNFELRLWRSADDLPRTAYVGKGAARCRTGGNVVFIWSMGAD